MIYGYKTIKQLSKKGPFTKYQLWHWTSRRHKNGLFRAILVGKKRLLINEELFEEWVKETNQKPSYNSRHSKAMRRKEKQDLEKAYDRVEDLLKPSVRNFLPVPSGASVEDFLNGFNKNNLGTQNDNAKVHPMASEPNSKGFFKRLYRLLFRADARTSCS